MNKPYDKIYLHSLVTTPYTKNTNDNGINDFQIWIYIEIEIPWYIIRV